MLYLSRTISNNVIAYNAFQFSAHCWQRGPNPLFYEDPSILPTPLFQILCNPPPCLLSVSPPTPTPTALSSAEWVIMPYLMCYFT